ncbi:hypothetical protein MHBO_002120 [Bonamia ostreae]|uniref:Uncharacterized protein n=1 Tax=Bonamia ostreae TaxID=126728 RepID=A0ABV2ALC3_9EUKA
MERILNDLKLDESYIEALEDNYIYSPEEMKKMGENDVIEIFGQKDAAVFIKWQKNSSRTTKNTKSKIQQKTKDSSKSLSKKLSSEKFSPKKPDLEKPPSKSKEDVSEKHLNHTGEHKRRLHRKKKRNSKIPKELLQASPNTAKSIESKQIFQKSLKYNFSPKRTQKSAKMPN